MDAGSKVTAFATSFILISLAGIQEVYFDVDARPPENCELAAGRCGTVSIDRICKVRHYPRCKKIKGGISMSRAQWAVALKAGTSGAFAIAVMLAGWTAPASAQAASPITMKLSTATVNDTQTEWLKRFAAAVEKDSGGRIKGEIYPNSQLGSIPRQIEGTQFNSIQVWCGPPEFLVGVDERYEALSAPGEFTSRAQYNKSIQDPAITDLILGLGANKGLIGGGIFSIGPSWILTKKQISTLGDFSGLKFRVLASPFQLELIKRMGGSPVAMTLADVLPALQQGAIDGSLTTITQYTTLHMIDAAKYVTRTGQPYVSSISVISKKWLDGLPPDLQKVVRDDAMKISVDILPYVDQFFDDQIKVWKDSGGVIEDLPAADQDAMIQKISNIGEDLSANKPALAAAVKTVFETSAKYK
jgi:TRAP-type C4-dicarboxylate transport system substrate-binding protein